MFVDRGRCGVLPSHAWRRVHRWIARIILRLSVSSHAPLPTAPCPSSLRADDERKQQRQPRPLATTGSKTTGTCRQGRPNESEGVHHVRQRLSSTSAQRSRQPHARVRIGRSRRRSATRTRSPIHRGGVHPAYRPCQKESPRPATTRNTSAATGTSRRRVRLVPAAASAATTDRARTGRCGSRGREVDEVTERGASRLQCATHLACCADDQPGQCFGCHGCGSRSRSFTISLRSTTTSVSRLAGSIW